MQRLIGSKDVGCHTQAGHDVATVGSRVIYRDHSDDGVEQVVIVPGAEADFEHGLISSDSPLARALLGHGIGDPVRALTPGGVRVLRIMAVEQVD